MESKDQYVSLGEFRALVASGAISEVSLEGVGAAFIVVAHCKNQSRAVLRALHTNTVREYKDPRRALEQLKTMGIVKATIKYEKWDTGQATI